jgi:hypothetical protein
MHKVVTIDSHGDEVEESRHDGYRDAALAYCRIVLRAPGQHVRWIDGDPLPGLPVTVVAERFGNPCEESCCVPLAEPWPEPDCHTV